MGTASRLLKGSILIAQQDPTQAVEESTRLGDDPGKWFQC